MAGFSQGLVSSLLVRIALVAPGSTLVHDSLVFTPYLCRHADPQYDHVLSLGVHVCDSWVRGSLFTRV